MTDRLAHARLVKLGADILNQRRWGDSIFAEDAKRQDDALAALGYEAGQIAKLLATPAPAQPDPLHVANERGEGEADIERLAETARNTYFGVSRRGPVQFGSIHPQSQQIWRNVVKAVLAAAPKEKP